MELTDTSGALPGDVPGPAVAPTPDTVAPSAESSPPPLEGIWKVLERRLDRGEYRPVQSPAVTANPMKTRLGEDYYILANRDRGKYVRLTPEEFHLWQLMDGTRTVKDLIFEYFTAFKTLAFDVVIDLVALLRRDFMLADPPRDVYASLDTVLGSARRRLWPRIAWQLVSGGRALQVHHIDGAMGALHRRVAWVLYTRPLQIVYVGVTLVGGAVFVLEFASGRYNLFQAAGSYGIGLALLVGLNLFGVMVHEACHALTCKHYGGQVHGGGVMIYFGLPTAFVDTTDIWTKQRSARLATTWAGPYSGAILAGLGALVVWVIPGSPVAPILLRLSFLWLLNLLFNAIPFVELDGYYMAIDWLEIPELRPRALAFFRRDLWGRLRHGKRLVGQERLFAWFGGLSALFSVLVILSALWAWESRFRDLATGMWKGGVGSAILMALLFLVLAFPLVAQGVAQARAGARRLAPWIERVRGPHGRALRERETLLRGVHCLSGLSPEEMRQTAATMARHVFHPGQTVVREGADAEHFYVVERGAAEMSVGDETRPRRRLTRGDYFGETALLEREAYAATVRATSWLSLFSIRRIDFDRWVRPHVCSGVDERLYTIQALKRTPLFAAVPARQLDSLASVAEREVFEPDQPVYREGDAADAVYIIESGQAEVAIGEDRRVLGPGEHFGENALLGDGARVADVRAVTPLEILKVPRSGFESVVATALAHSTTGDGDKLPDPMRRICCPSAAGARGG